MAFPEDIFESNLVVVAVLGATALILPKVLPELPSPVRSLVKSGVDLLLESEAEAEGGIIDRLAETALKNTLGKLSGGGPDGNRRAAAQAAIETYKRIARSRARRYARDDHDRAARYARHMKMLRRKLESAKSQQPASEQSRLASLLAALDKDVTPLTEELPDGTA